MTKGLIAKIDALNKDAWDVRVNDSNKAHELSRQALDLANADNYTKGQAEASRTLGFTFIRLSQHNEAIIYLNDALKKFEFLNDLRGQSDVYEYYGIIRRSFGDYKSSLDALYKALDLRKQTGYTDGESLSLYHLGVTYRYLGNLEQALDYFLQSLIIGRSINAWISISYSLNNLGSIYLELNDYANALHYFKESLAIRKQSNDKWGEAGCLDNIGYIYLKTSDYKNAIDYCSQSLEISRSVGDKKGEANALFHLAEIYLIQANYHQARQKANESLEIRKSIGDKKGEAELFLVLALLESDSKEKELVENYLINALALADETKAVDLLQRTHERCYKFYRQQRNYKKALIHLEASYKYERELHSSALNQKILNLEIKYKIEQSKKEAELMQLRNEELTKLNNEIEEQKHALERTLENLKSAQAQLIQSEKMASLGELTAGIAHEIQNPLNFVNNFSDLSNELIDEMKEELVAGNLQLATEIADDIKQNLGKINHHGKRAESIVTGMLQHSRTSTGQKEPTDINKLADEYLRLAYHGLRAKDRDFNCEIITDFDASISKINLIALDIGRVILNLVNNAFYACAERSRSAVNEKQKACQAAPPERGVEASENYKPTISVSTKKTGNRIELSVADNGNGIPQKIVDKIFQPFFTTKPTGQGTGLGLSLSYDIVKAHGGEMKVNSIAGCHTEFIVTLSAVPI